MPLLVRSNRDELELRVCELALQIVRRFAAHAPITPDGFMEIAYKDFLIRHATPFTRPEITRRLIVERRQGMPAYSRSYHVLEIVIDGRCVFCVNWDHERHKWISSHVEFADVLWESEFLRESNWLLTEQQNVDKKPLKRELRRLAAVTLQQAGYTTEDVGGAGVAPGARLLARKGLTRKQIAVRTSHDRKVGLTRTANGNWRTIPKVRNVLVATIASDDPTFVEVFCFEAAVLLKAFDRQIRRNRSLRKGSDGIRPPVFMALDPSRADPDGIKSNLKAKAEWSRRLPLKLSAPSETSAVALKEFIARTVQEYAAIVGVDVADVAVDFHVTGRGK